MEQSNKDIENKIFSVEFRKFFNKEFLPNLKQVEKKRLKYIISIILIFMIDIFLIIAFLYLFFINHSIDGVYLFIYIPMALFFGFYACIYVLRLYRVIIKKIVFAKLLSFIGNFRIPDKRIDPSYIKNLKLFNEIALLLVDDWFIGQYGILDVEIQEIKLHFAQGNNSYKITDTKFNGLLIKIPCLKKFKGTTIIKRKNSMLSKEVGKKVNIEDIEFNKYFDVYSDDQIEARYLITTAFINRAVQLANHDIGKNITISFEYGNVNMAIESNKDWFEASILKPATDIENYRAIVLEIISVLKIIDSLKLEKNIGL